MTSSGTASSTMTVDEMVESLTGFDEIAIEKHFNGFDIYDDGQAKGVRALRCLAFVHFRRQGETDRDALTKAQEMSFKDVSSMFAQAEPEIDPDEPETEAGKDFMQPA